MTYREEAIMVLISILGLTGWIVAFTWWRIAKSWEKCANDAHQNFMKLAGESMTSQDSLNDLWRNAAERAVLMILRKYDPTKAELFEKEWKALCE